jgi:hypothetical protein
MATDTTGLLSTWNEFKVLVESVEVDLHKNLKGNKSAGVRTRKGLRLAKKLASDIIKQSMTTADDTAET